MRKSQASIQLLLVYGISIVIIAAVAVTLYSLGVFSPSRFLQNSVIGFSGFSVSQTCTPGGALALTVTNAQNIPVEITSINATPLGLPAVSLPSTIILQPDQAQLFFIRNACASKTNSQYSGTASVYYITGSTTSPGPFSSNGEYQGTSLSSYTPVLSALFNPAQNSRIIVKSSSTLNITGSVTVSAWYYLLAPLGGCTVNGLVWKSLTMFPGGANPVGGYNLAIGCTVGTEYEDGPQNTSGWVTYNIPASDPYYGRWIFLAGERNGATNTLSLFLNGTLLSSNTGTTWPLTNSVANLSIGSFGSTGGYYFNGTIADVQVYNTALNTTQISKLYSEGMGAGPLSGAGLEAWWPLDGNALDYSGNGNNGVVLNNVNWVSPSSP